MSAVRWVRQEDAGGCAPATLAMLTGRTYREARDLIDGMWERGPKDWSEGGCSNYDIDRVLFFDGFFIQRRYATYSQGTTVLLDFPVTFAPLHYAMVEQPSGNHHFVVVLADGTVLDAMREGEYALSDWSRVLQIVGLVRP